MPLEIRQEEVGGIHVLAPQGRLDTDTAADFELALQDLLAGGAKHFVLDFSAIGYVSSAGLRVLLMLAKQLDSGAGSLRLAGLSAHVKQVFDIAGFSKLFRLYPDRAAALIGHGAQSTPAVSASDDSLARAAAKLLGAETTSSASAADAGLVKAAATLLGAGGAASASKPAAARPATATPSAAPAAKAAAPTTAPANPPARQRAPAAADAPAEGFWARLKARFSGR